MLLLTMRVHDHDIIQRRLHHSNASTSKTMKTNNSHKHLRRLKDKSSQHNLLTVRPPVRNVYVQLNNSRRPFPQTVNVGKAARELVLRNFVPSHSLRPQTLQQANIELWGEGVCVQKQLHARNAQILVLRTFVLQQSLIIGSSID